MKQKDFIDKVKNHLQGTKLEFMYKCSDRNTMGYTHTCRVKVNGFFEFIYRVYSWNDRNIYLISDDYTHVIKTIEV